MSDEIKDSSAPAQTGLSEDKFSNFKHEMERKLDNQNQQISQLIAELKASRKPEAPIQQTETKKVSVFDDEEAYARAIEERTAAKIKAELSQQQAAQNRHQTVVSSIINDYPEVQDESSALMVRSKEIFASYGEDDRLSPLAMKAAVSAAAAELGLKPRSKRSGDDNFTVSSSTSGYRQSGSRRQQSAELDPRTEEFARIMGLDTSKKEVRERLKSRSGRDYTKYSG